MKHILFGIFFFTQATRSALLFSFSCLNNLEYQSGFF